MLRLVFAMTVVAMVQAVPTQKDDLSAFPALKRLVRMASESPEELAQMIRESELAAIVPTFDFEDFNATVGNGLPVVLGHGMGDSCFNEGMKSITKMAGTRSGAYSVCVPTGDNVISDTINGFLMTMDKSVDVFAEKIKNDKNLANGFNAMGFSQGNSLIRGYINKYNDPPVNAFVSVHGTVSGVAACPQCNPSGILSPICDVVAEVLGDLAYLEIVQDILFQADYYRDPMKVNTDQFKKNSQLAQWNNEGETVHPEYATNFAKTNKFAMVKALADTMVFPNEGEHWGHFADDSYKTVLTMKETNWYKNDTFGLKTADEAGKIFFEQTTGNHLEFTNEELYGWIDKYFLGKN